MKKAIILAATTTIGWVYLSSPVFAQTTVFSDNFTSDSSLAQPPWYNLNNSSAASNALNPTAGQGLALTVTSGSTGKVNEMFAQFTPVTLTEGEYITLTANFNSPNTSGGFASDTGGLLAGLYNNTIVASSNEMGSTSGSTGTGGETAPSKGYFGIMGYNTSASTSTKFYSRQGGVSDENELGYYSEMTAGSFTQLSSFGASGNATLANSTAYTLTYTITDEGASGNQIDATISSGSTTLDNWISTDASGLYDTFNQLDFGNYGKAGAVDMNILTEAMTTGVVPEPTSLALTTAGMGLAFLVRLRRR
jgi:hypothetical protein